MRKETGKESGFSLIELVVLLGLVSIITLMAFPALKKISENFQLRGAAMDVLSYFQKARMEAVKLNTNVAMKFTSGNPGKFIMFVDNGAGAGTAGNIIRDGSEELLRDINLPEGVILDSTTFNSNRAGFDAKGLPLKKQLGRVKLTNRNSKKYQIVLSLAGNVRLENKWD